MSSYNDYSKQVNSPLPQVVSGSPGEIKSSPVKIIPEDAKAQVEIKKLQDLQQNAEVKVSDDLHGRGNLNEEFTKPIPPALERFGVHIESPAQEEISVDLPVMQELSPEELELLALESQDQELAQDIASKEEALDAKTHIKEKRDELISEDTSNLVKEEENKGVGIAAIAADMAILDADGLSKTYRLNDLGIPELVPPPTTEAAREALIRDAHNLIIFTPRGPVVAPGVRARLPALMHFPMPGGGVRIVKRDAIIERTKEEQETFVRALTKYLFGFPLGQSLKKMESKKDEHVERRSSPTRAPGISSSKPQPKKEVRHSDTTRDMNKDELQRQSSEKAHLAEEKFRRKSLEKGKEYNEKRDQIRKEDQAGEALHHDVIQEEKTNEGKNIP